MTGGKRRTKTGERDAGQTRDLIISSFPVSSLVLSPARHVLHPSANAVRSSSLDAAVSHSTGDGGGGAGASASAAAAALRGSARRADVALRAAAMSRVRVRV
jgi:hypothetical protein